MAYAMSFNKITPLHRMDAMFIAQVWGIFRDCSHTRIVNNVHSLLEPEDR